MKPTKLYHLTQIKFGLVLDFIGSLSGSDRIKIVNAFKKQFDNFGYRVFMPIILSEAINRLDADAKKQLNNILNDMLNEGWGGVQLIALRQMIRSYCPDLIQKILQVATHNTEEELKRETANNRHYQR